MIGAFKRAFRGSEERDSWTVKKEQEPEKVQAPSEKPDETQAEEHRGVFVPYDTDVVQQQVELVRAAMAQGGRFGDQEIPIPWLRMMLAALEGRPIDQDAIWEGIASPARSDPIEGSAGYQELFPSRP